MTYHSFLKLRRRQTSSLLPLSWAQFGGASPGWGSGGFRTLSPGPLRQPSVPARLALRYRWIEPVLLYGQLPRWCALIAAACCYAGAFLDFCDGAVARARKSANEIGGIIDGITTDFIRSGLLVVLGIVARSAAFAIVGLVSAYIVVWLRNQFIWSGLYASEAQPSKSSASSIFRWAFSVHVMIAVLPLAFGAAIGLWLRPELCEECFSSVSCAVDRLVLARV